VQVKIADAKDNLNRIAKIPNIVERKGLESRYRTVLEILDK